MDKWLALFIGLLVITLLLFFTGYFPYPFGFIILLIAIYARWSSLNANE